MAKSPDKTRLLRSFGPPRRRVRSVGATRAPVAAPQRPYDRRAELPRVLPLWPRELDDESAEGRRLILARLRCALRAERRRGIAGHWTYDLSRHVQLLRVYRAELEEVKKGMGKRGMGGRE